MTFPVRKTAGSAVAMGTLAAVLTWPANATAAVDPANPCDLHDWFQNGDEADRAPERTTKGFVFDGTDLVHHAAPAGLTVEDLTNGGFTADKNPDQPSFFSVEVFGADGGYATLRWDRVALLWTMTTGGTTYTDTDPAKLADKPPVKRSHAVKTFGVGYTANPPGTVTTTVTSVSFLGKAYVLSCPKPIDPSPSPSATASPKPTPSATTTSASPSGSVSASATATASTSASTSSSASQTVPVLPSGNGEATGGGQLPTTGGHRLQYLAGAGLGVLLAGLALVWVVRRFRKA